MLTKIQKRPKNSKLHFHAFLYSNKFFMSYIYRRYYSSDENDRSVWVSDFHDGSGRCIFMMEKKNNKVVVLTSLFVFVPVYGFVTNQIETQKEEPKEATGAEICVHDEE